ncbi:MAG: DNA-formamidopyrimidine glycosylase [Robiginitomaculum sp.]|nr:MAG: DNA-formamidopyrimidine glycosylase [Robiginitomaculum sp.]
MPELPEVETVCKGLTPVMENREFLSVTLNRSDIRFPFPDNFVKRLEATTITRLSRRAKFLVAELSSGETLLMHLGMTGRFSIDTKTSPIDPDATNPKHDHVIFVMSALHNEQGAPTIYYNDPRRFGFMELLAVGETGRHDTLGPEPLSNSFSGPVLYEAIHTKKSPIKTTLLDQNIVAGLGNIYVCEALFDARISPLRKSCDVSSEECDTLCTEIKRTLDLAIKAGGSTLKDFAATDGALGYFQHSFKVYDRAKTPCPNPDCDDTITRIKQSGRSSFYCLKCQK